MRRIYIKEADRETKIRKFDIHKDDYLIGKAGDQPAKLRYKGGGHWAYFNNIGCGGEFDAEGYTHLQTVAASKGNTLGEIIRYYSCSRGTFSPEASEDCILLEPTCSASFMMDRYSMDRIYTGQGSYHSHSYSDLNKPVVEFKGHCIGVELEVEGKDSGCKEDIIDARSNWFYMESDASLGSNGIELITIPLLPKDAKSPNTWAPLIDFLSGRAKSWSTGRCGLHVHIGREILGSNAEEQSETIGKMLYLYHHGLKDNSVNVSIYGRSRAYHDQNGAVESARAAKNLGPAVFKVKEVKDKVKGDLFRQSSSGRYFDINISPANTIEFRKGRGSINVNRICAIVEYSELIALYARKAKWDKVSVDDFFEWARKRVKRSSPLSRWISQDEMCV